ncbi:ABC transporter ATP-binding protein [Streptomonospora wellingtoniae]|uniref:ATP-binding cassette domain-containing protein n=1 Tax=Streptomonospora wellingtoniae TaxID=3075544 RepID=A0ABU2KT71_9ACTN|nr:ATP-binding cassette domain-containing protein [Streptomonospora sp. DSM 45055]MDT0302485.1 ATP-binding cassette domain-containing protein [Streptomonospora sp. DSM 45055]
MYEEEAVISARGLSKRYGSVEAVADVTFDAARGRVVGFLGPNGAGKTTTLRMLLGLVRPSSGQARVLGSPYRELHRPLRRVGVSVEADAFVGGRTGRNHLRCYAGLAGCGRRRVDELLELVDLRGAADRAVRGYSTGMKRRLSVATALLGDPDALILDEPANGLDPDGIIWLRGLLRDFAEQGRTVLLSSHLLDEMQKIVDDVLLVNRGRVLHAGPLDRLLGAEACLVRSAAGRQDAVRGVVEAHGHDRLPLADGRLWVGAPPREVRTALEAQEDTAGPVHVEPCTLESEFMRLTRNDREEVAL